MEIQELWQELDDQQAEKLSGGDSNLDSVAATVFSDRIRLGYSTASNTVIIAESSIAGKEIPPPSGKIRGTLLF